MDMETSGITLKCSSALISDFFRIGVNAILYQRRIYPCESFTKEEAYSSAVYICKNEDIKDYISQFTSQLKGWLEEKTIKKVVVVIISVITREPIERWQFDIVSDEAIDEKTKVTEKSIMELEHEMRDLLRQIDNIVTILPLLEDLSSFNILAYTDIDVETPPAWENGGDHYIANSEEVKLKKLNTIIHKVDAGVCYKVD